ncbi:hypothetical protein RHGRI_007156 [Rhododendron griersonianum]|uniref:Uncharacterized protein n=1 Tax=Rhododendron griersonianum TaxID=479676 RepID=A0AAV6KX01_9ERIC|nr:hypothetical protein RHGRI_007156 [Rhododendron griersonianum]
MAFPELEEAINDTGRTRRDVVLSFDGKFALSGSWDGELRLWDLASGTTVRRFVGHTKGVLSVTFSLDNCQIISASCDRSIKLSNTLDAVRVLVSSLADESLMVREASMASLKDIALLYARPSGTTQFI